MKVAPARFPCALFTVYALLWIGLAIAPPDRATWLLENLLVVAVVALLVLTHHRFPFSNLSYLCIAIYLSLHAVGAHYSYKEAPPGEWLRTAFQLERNPFDRIGHFAFGLLLVFPMREILGRLAGLRGASTYWMPLAVVLALSTLFEIIEALVAEIISPGAGPAWLGAQGDEWDAQVDMAAAMAGTLLAIFLAPIVERVSDHRPSRPSRSSSPAVR